MPVYSYRAINEASRSVRGAIRADSPRQARSQLIAQGMRPTQLRVEEALQKKNLGVVSESIKRIQAIRQHSRVIDAFENLLTLLESHVPLEEAWETLINADAKQRTPLLHQFHDGIRLGNSMWSIMERFPHHFDAADVALIRAGEDAGELSAALSRFIIRQGMSHKLLSTFLGAIAYPLFLMVFGSLVILFLTTRVLPSLNALLVAAGGQVPWPTAVLIWFGRFLAWGIVPAVLAILIVVAASQRDRSRLRRQLIRTALKIPVVGRAMLDWHLAQFCQMLHTLLASGIHLPEALILAGNSTGESPISHAASKLRERLLEGQDLGQAGIHNGMEGFPPWLWRALSVGQATGDLLPVLERAGKRFEQSATQSASRLAAVLEPAMILFVGAVVALIAYGAMLPIVRLGGAW